jgi:hypothetical protein
MKIRDINKPINSKTLNETLAKQFGTKLNVDSFTLEQLQDARNKVRTMISQIETNESFSGLPKNETYAKNKLFLDVLNAAISERSDVDEAKKPDADGDGVPDWADKKDGPDPKPKKKGTKNMPPQLKKHAEKKMKGESMQVDEFMGVDSPDEVDKNLQKAIQKKFGTMSGRNLGKVQGRTYGDNSVEIDDPAVQMMIDAGILTLNPAAEKAYKAISPAKRAEIMKKIDQFNKDKAAVATDPGNKPMAKAKKAPGSLFDLLGAKESMDEGKQIIENYFKYSLKLVEGEEDKAELVMASKDMVDRLTGWMEDTAEMQSESMLELADAIRDEMGQQESDAFVNTVKPALEQLYASMETTREALTAGVGQLTGEGEAPAMDMGEPMDMEAPMDDPVGDEAEMEPVEDDGMATAPAAVGGEDEAGRARRESRYHKKKAMLETSRRLGTILSKKK